MLKAVSAGSDLYLLDTGWKTAVHIPSTVTYHETDIAVPVEDDITHILFDIVTGDGARVPTVDEVAVQLTTTHPYDGGTTQETTHNASNFFYGNNYANSKNTGTIAASGGIHRAYDSGNNTPFLNGHASSFSFAPIAGASASFNFYTQTNTYDLYFAYRLRMLTHAKALEIFA